MKKILMCLFCFIFLLIHCSKAEASSIMSKGYQYYDLGGIYTNTTFPDDVATVYDNANIDLSKLKKGEAKSTNVLYIVELGDSGVKAATQNGGITKVHYVDVKYQKIFIPLLFVPIFVSERTTTVYGE